jgi:hypothetical protein
MTLTIKTESQEEIELNLFSDYEFARIGKYVFPTRNLCSLIKEIADNPLSRKGRLVGTEPLDMNDRLEGLFSMEFERIVPVEISEDYSNVSIGDYKIPSSQMDWFTTYFTFGGWTHWGIPFKRKTPPEFAEQTSLAVKNSQNLLFIPQHVN